MTKLDIQPVRAKLFMHGGSQAVRLPRAFRFEGSEVTVRREGDAVILEPVRSQRFRTADDRRAFWEQLDALCDAPFPEREPQLALDEIDLES